MKCLRSRTCMEHVSALWISHSLSRCIIENFMTLKASLKLSEECTMKTSLCFILLTVKKELDGTDSDHYTSLFTMEPHTD